MAPKKNAPRMNSRISMEMTFSFHNGLEATGITREKEEDNEEERKEDVISSEVTPACSFEEADAKTNDDAFLKRYQKIIQKTNVNLDTLLSKREPKLDGINMFFTDDVIEMRCPHKIPFSQYKSNSLYHDTTDIINTESKRRKRPQRMPKRSKSCSDLAQNEGKIPEMKSFMFGVGDDNETVINRYKLIHHAFESFSPYYQEKVKNKPTITWEQHVLSKMSNDSAQNIIKKATNHRVAAKWKQFVSKSTNQEKSKSDQKVNDENQVNDDDTVKKDNEGRKKEEIGVEIDYFENIPVKPEMESYVCQDVYPSKPNKWQKWRRRPADAAKIGKVIRGLRKWTAPPLIKAESQVELAKPSETQLFDLSRVTYCKIKKKATTNLIPILKEWRSKWLLEKEWERMSLETLEEALKSINDHTRLAAATALGEVVMNHRNLPENEDDIPNNEHEYSIIDKLNRLLEDKSLYVCIAAAATLFCIDRPVAKAATVLLKTVTGGMPDEQWLAVQCLTEYDFYEDCIVKALVDFVFSEDTVKQVKSKQLLGRISSLSNSVLCMISEKLNNASWKHRTVACEMLTTLDGNISEDIANKLCYLSWNDWSAGVRYAATVALGKTGNGKLMHMVLRRLLESGVSHKQISALETIATLGIMTGHFLLPLISCFSGNDAVVLQAVKTCRILKISDEKILHTLCTIINSDKPFKLKKFTLRALGDIGSKSDLVRDLLLDTLRFHIDAKLRKEACQAMIKLGLKDDQIVSVLQDLVFIDDNEEVRRVCRAAIDAMNLDVVGDTNLKEAIQKYITDLGTKENIIAFIMAEENGKLPDITKKTSSITDYRKFDPPKHISSPLETKNVFKGKINKL